MPLEFGTNKLLTIQNLVITISKIWNHFQLSIVKKYSKIISSFLFYINGVKCESFQTLGIPYIHVSYNAKCVIGKNFKMNNGARYSDSGLNGKCRIEVRDTAVLTIANNVGISDVTITCHEKISIGNNVIIGVGSQIRDTDNHSLNHLDRLTGQDWANKKTSAVKIHDNVFIGAGCFILKGVTIGENSIIGAGSVVTRNVPGNEMWGGNPAKPLKNSFNAFDK